MVGRELFVLYSPLPRRARLALAGLWGGSRGSRGDRVRTHCTARTHEALHARTRDRGDRGTARTQCTHALRACTARMHCAYALHACTARMHCTHALRACTARVHCTHALHACTARMHCTRALHACPTPYTHALHACTARMHCTHPLHACSTRMPCTHALPACAARMSYTHALPACTARTHHTQALHACTRMHCTRVCACVCRGADGKKVGARGAHAHLMTDVARARANSACPPPLPWKEESTCRRGALREPP